MIKEKILTKISQVVADDGKIHTVTLVGRYRKVKELTYSTTKLVQPNGLTKTIVDPIKKIKREFAMAYAICHPEDEYDKKIGESIALRRIKNGDTIGTLMSYDVTMLNEKQRESWMEYEMTRIVDNINNYIK